MAVDTATTIAGFDTAKPESSDPKSEGDGNFRHIKSVLKTTFPYVTGVVTPTLAQLNYLAGVTSDLQTQIDAKLAKVAIYGAIGTHVFAKAPSAKNGGETIAGNTLQPAGITTGGAQVTSADSVFTGSWMCMGYAPNSSDVSLFVRVS